MKETSFSEFSAGAETQARTHEADGHGGAAFSQSDITFSQSDVFSFYNAII